VTRRAPLLVVGLFFLVALPARATIVYRVSVAHPEQHIFHVTMFIPGAQGGAVVQMPAWNALYQIRDFSSRITDVRGRVRPDEVGRPQTALSVVKLDKQTWKIGPPPAGETSNDVYVDYQISWDEPGPFSTQLNEHHAFLNFAEILLYVPDRRGEKSEVFLRDVPADWKIAVALGRGEQPNELIAPGYDALVDAPVEMGKFQEFQFEDAGARYRAVVDGNDWNVQKLGSALQSLVAYEVKLMGGAPFPEYLFIFHVGSGDEVGGGGMEHANSTAIAVNSGESAASIAAHEFFHAWNVKRIRPQSLEPVEFTKEQYTRALWFSEGVTSTYASYALERTQIWSRNQFYDDFANEFDELDSRPARLWQSLEQSSLDAWLEKYPLYRRPESSISYYNKGKIVGLLLDIVIRDATDNHKSLDDVMRALNDQFAKAGRFYPDSPGIRGVAEQVCACDLGEFFALYVSGTDEIPYAGFLRDAGWQLKKETRVFADLGFSPGRGPGGAVIASAITPRGPAEAAGLHEGDLIIELNSSPVPRNLIRWLREHKPGETIQLRIRRGTVESEISYGLGKRESSAYRMEENTGAGEKQIRIRNGILRGTTD
jgi:predicted metalloprotease with PDZ domain